MSKTLKIQTASGIYEVKKPGGMLGTKSMVMISEIAMADGLMKMPGPEEDQSLVEKVQEHNNKVTMKKAEEVFMKWAPVVIPDILVTLDGGPITYDDVSGEDQLAIFLAVSSEMRMSEDFFRVVP